MKVSRVCTIHLIFLAVSVSFLVDITQAEDKLKVTEARTQPSEGLRVVRFANDRLTVRVQDVSLHELLQEIARQSGLTLVVSGSVEDRIIKDRVTIAFNKVSLDAGLRRILRQQSFALQYAQQTSEERLSTVPRPRKLWILPKGEEDYAVDDNKGEDALPGVATDIARLEAALKSEDSGDREEAVEALGESGRPEAVPALRLALQDEDDDVRQAAIDALADIGGDAAAQALALALRDENASNRREAVDSLADIGGDAATQALAIALRDEDPSVREEAAEALEEIGGETATRLLEQALAGEDEAIRNDAAN